MPPAVSPPPRLLPHAGSPRKLQGNGVLNGTPVPGVRKEPAARPATPWAPRSCRRGRRRGQRWPQRARRGRERAQALRAQRWCVQHVNLKQGATAVHRPRPGPTAAASDRQGRRPQGGGAQEPLRTCTAANMHNTTPGRTCRHRSDELGAEVAVRGEPAGVGVLVLEVARGDALLCAQEVGVLGREAALP